MSLRGEQSPVWRGDKATYMKKHDWVRANWEKPTLCEKCGKDKKLDWASVSGKCRRSDRKDWMALCRSCHTKMDWTPERSRKQSEALKRYANSDEGKLSMSERGQIGGKVTARLYPRQRNAKGQFTQITPTLTLQESGNA